jgi:N-acetylmuramoyl-L-alanine amidase
MWIRVSGFLLVFFLSVSSGNAQQLQALARVDVSESAIVDARGDGIGIHLALSQPVPFRLFTLDDPLRLVLDFQEVDWQGFDENRILKTEKVADVRYGVFRPGWSRMVIDLPRPLVIDLAEMKTDRVRGTARLTVNLKPASAAEFAKASGAFRSEEWAVPRGDKGIKPKTRQIGNRPLVVAIDPGHGGIDSGASREGFKEKDLVLRFSRELKDALIRSGRYKARLTREDDIFVSLPARITIARQMGADVFISIHADALSEGRATGTTIYTLSGEASDTAAEQLARQHDRSDLLAGVDLRAQDDLIAGVLMDMARLETGVRSDLLAEMLVSGIGQSVGRIRKRPHLSAGFTVLKAPDIPSVLVELGFMSNRSDLNNLLTADWRSKVIRGVLLALDTWAFEDAAQARLLRQ